MKIIILSAILFTFAPFAARADYEDFTIDRELDLSRTIVILNQDTNRNDYIIEYDSSIIDGCSLNESDEIQVFIDADGGISEGNTIIKEGIVEDDTCVVLADAEALNLIKADVVESDIDSNQLIAEYGSVEYVIEYDLSCTWLDFSTLEPMYIDGNGLSISDNDTIYIGDYYNTSCVIENVETLSVPPTPERLKNVEIKKTKAQVRWRLMFTADSYKVQVLKGNAIVKSGTVLHRNLLITELTSKTKYKWRVRSCNEYGCGTWSEYKKFTTL